ncbi:MAG: Uma2 family endonuclease [Gemmataceae bacterium]
MATIADLMRVEGRAELVNGEVVRLKPFTDWQSMIVGNVKHSLHDHARAHRGTGRSGGGTLVYAFAPLRGGRMTFSPAAAWFIGPRPDDPMGPVPGPPTFAMEFEDEMTDARRADYAEAGTLVLWEVNAREERIVKRRPGHAPEASFVRGDVADAEPAVPGWTIAVDDVFEDL